MKSTQSLSVFEKSLFCGTAVLDNYINLVSKTTSLKDFMVEYLDQMGRVSLDTVITGPSIFGEKPTMFGCLV